MLITVTVQSSTFLIFVYYLVWVFWHTLFFFYICDICDILIPYVRDFNNLNVNFVCEGFLYVEWCVMFEKYAGKLACHFDAHCINKKPENKNLESCGLFYALLV